MFLWRARLLKSGYSFGKISGAAYGDEIDYCGLPDKVIIPLRQGFSAETSCLVSKGERVRSGQIIGRDDHTWSSPVHSSINGTVEYFEYFSEGGVSHSGVVIRRDHSDERGYIPLPGGGSADKSAEEIGDILYLSGVTALGTTGIPTSHHTSDMTVEDVKALVVNGLSGEPFSLPGEVLMKAREGDFATGIRLLMKLLSLESEVHVVLKKELKRQGMVLPLPDGAKIHFVENRYPFDMPEIISEIASGRRVPNGATPSEAGVLVVDVQDVLHVFDAVLLGKPLIERTISVGGSGVNNPCIVRVPVGTPVDWLLSGRLIENISPRILVGGGMRGKFLESPAHPVERTFSPITIMHEDMERDFIPFLMPGVSVLSASRAFLSSFFSRSRRAETNIQGEKRPCIYCSYCEDLCPRSLVPHLYSKQVMNGLPEDALSYSMDACIECGLCSFVCPSKIPLLDHIRKGLKELEEKGRWHRKSGFRKLDEGGVP